MKANLPIISSQEKVNFNGPMEILILDQYLMGKDMGLDSLTVQVISPLIKDPGVKGLKMGKEYSASLMEVFIKVILRMDLEREKGK
jgi:hypothetical protein